ncbi:MAG: glycoside hydrolase family 127 protein [Lachnospiraceae bacterium]|nr:glycoside hydrolase family 127 protein [Lachnospiraceae bacterium]
MDAKKFSDPLSLRDIKVTDNFWKNEMELVRTKVIPYQWDALNDNVPGAAPSFCMKNYKLAADLNARKRANPSYEQPVWTTSNFNLVPEDINNREERFYGFLFQDTDFTKWVEAVAYSLTQHPDAALEQLADDAIDVVCAAQLDNGYLDTFYIINDQKKIFSNLRDNHELYCFGHLTEGAVAYYEATGKDKLLKTACRFADYIDSHFGPEEGKCKGYPGHEIAEMALVRLYHATGEERYLNLSRFFIDGRGRQPYYFDSEVDHKFTPKPGDAPLRHFYHQAHLPVREQTEAVGHAVRAVYLYSGMADIARLTGDESLLAACETLWDNIVNKKMYITGGIGSTNHGEAFTYAYDLPNDMAYAETCASIGMVFFARRMLQIKPDARYANVMERELFNGVLSGMALDGKSFFYVNPLEVLPEACHKDERKFHVKPVRQKWFGCACCPPNIARLVSSIASYACTEREDTLFVHLYMGCELKKKVGEKEVSIRIVSGFPYDGKVTVAVNTDTPVGMTLALRLPDWATECTINGVTTTKVALCDGTGDTLEGFGNKANISAPDAILTKIAETTGASFASVSDGYLYLTGTWSGNTDINLDFPMTIRIIAANPSVREDIGKVAVTYGPMVYCLEEADNKNNLHLLRLDCAHPDFKIMPDGILGAPSITANGYREEKAEEGAKLYHVYQPVKLTKCQLTFLPYYMWNNRGEGEMTVWVRSM